VRRDLVVDGGYQRRSSIGWRARRARESDSVAVSTRKFNYTTAVARRFNEGKCPSNSSSSMMCSPGPRKGMEDGALTRVFPCAYRLIRFIYIHIYIYILSIPLCMEIVSKFVAPR